MQKESWTFDLHKLSRRQPNAIGPLDGIADSLTGNKRGLNPDSCKCKMYFPNHILKCGVKHVCITFTPIWTVSI